MKDISIQYPDGRFHTVSVYRFYSVMYNGREEYVIEYDDLSDNVRGCFAILDKENNIFVKRPLENSAAYRVFYNSIRFMYKKPQALYLLPNTINLCRSALEALVPFAPPVQEVAPVRTQTRRQVIVFVDVSPNHDAYPYYIDQATARALGFMCSGPYYHLNPSLMESLRRAFDVVEQTIQLNLVMENKPGKKPAAQAAAAGSPPPPPPGGGGGGNNPPGGNPPSTVTATAIPPKKQPPRRPEEVVVYEDISPIREEFPFYLSIKDAKRFGLKVDESKPYYHLNKAEFDVISRYAIVKLEKRELAILPQKKRPAGKKPVVNKVEPLNAKEIETLEGLFEGLMDFEDYYSFFGIEELRNASVDLVLNSPRIIALTKLFNKGVACGNDLAINLSEFMEGFLNELRQKSKKF